MTAWRWLACRCCASPSSSACNRPHLPFGGLSATPTSGWRGSSGRPGRSMIPRATGRLLAVRACHVRCRFPPGRHRPQRLLLPSDPGRGDGRGRCPGAGLPGDPGRHRPDRAATARHQRPPADGLCRNAAFLRVLLEKGHELGLATDLVAEGAAFRRGGSARAQRWLASPRDRRLPGVWNRRPRPHRLRDLGARGRLVVDEAIILEFAGPGTGRPVGPGPSARSSSPPSIRTIR